MDSKALDAIKEQLQKERSQIESKADKLRGELTDLEEDLVRISSAIAALEGTDFQAAGGKAAKSKERKKISAPSAGKADVIDQVQQILRSRGVVKSADLRSLVEEEITKAGFTRMGFSLRFKEALADPKFIETPEGICLRDAKNASVSS